jgi:hypothetical protein
MVPVVQSKRILTEPVEGKPSFIPCLGIGSITFNCLGKWPNGAAIKYGTDTVAGCGSSLLAGNK